MPFILSRQTQKAVGLGVSVALKHWDAEAQKVTDDCPDRDNIQFQITAKVKEYEKKIRRLEIMDIPVTFEISLNRTAND